jgi:cell wall-associated NlpC family hydrolase
VARARGLIAMAMLLALVAVPAAQAEEPAPAPVPPISGGVAPSPAPTPTNTGGAQYDVPVVHPTVPGFVAQLVNGVAYAPAAAPLEVQKAIWAGNAIQGKPYVYGGGHNRAFKSSGYDCSGTVSYALHGGGLLRSPLDSSSFMRWGRKGAGQWITVYTNPGHAFVVIAGLRLDTSAASDPSRARGPRWRPTMRSTRGYRARHPDGF